MDTLEEKNLIGRKNLLDKWYKQSLKHPVIISFMAFDRDRGSRGGGGRSFGHKSFDRNQSFDRPMFQTTCSDCGKECEVPFRPTGERPVYCRDCYAKHGGGENRNSRPSFRRDDNRSQAPSNNGQLSEINAKLDQLIKLLSPKEDVKPVQEKAEKKVAVKKKKTVKKVSETPTETLEKV